MCGICGVVGPARSARAEDVESMARALEHRGPDDFGVWQTRTRLGDADVVAAFGHTRLSILDLSAQGHQPMLSADGSCAITYNGEVYNFAEIRDQLVARGCAFRSDGDTEVILEAVRVLGDDAFPLLNGMFAFGLWDGRRERLQLVRDRLGIKPLYYAVYDGTLIFASELSALRRHRAFEAAIDPEGLARFLRYGYVPGPGTIYRGVKRLQPGEVLTWQASEISVERWWNLLEPQLEGEPPPRDDRAALSRLEELLGDAVQRRLVSDVPLGAFLSGGVDSSTVVALMCERARGGVRTFSIGVRERDWDEAPHARAVAAHLGTDHTELYVSSEQAAEVARELPVLYDEPFADTSAIPTVLLSRLTREHVTVALSGDGGDELFGGYDHHRQLQSSAPWLRLPRWLRRTAVGAAALAPRPRMQRWLRGLDQDDPAALAHALASRFDANALREICGPDRAHASETYLRAFDTAPAAEPARRSMYADIATWLPDDILTKVDRASMSVGLEARVPLLDHQVVRYALSLPLELLWRKNQTKAPLRDVLYRRVPAHLIERPKHGFSIPIDVLLARELEAWTDRYLAPARLREEGLLDANAVQREVARVRSGRRENPRSLWYLLCFERWFAHALRGEAAV